ncbi:MAG: hypothetical protein K2J30_01060 [Clostridia bacterium]|nr:hypothetical protein [Clostridia bacterium]
MAKKKNKHQKYNQNHGQTDTDYAHNARYCMILPDAAHADEEEIVSTGQS